MILPTYAVNLPEAFVLLLVGSCKKMKVTELSQAEIEDIAYCCTVPSIQLSRLAIVTMKAFLPKLGHNGLVIKIW